MSRDLFVSALDLDKFRAVHGSGDKKLLRKIERDRKQQLADHDEYWGKRTDHYLPLGSAIQQILAGQIDERARPRFQFEHAVALVADTLGESLDSGAFMESNPAFWDEVDFVIRLRRHVARMRKSFWPTLDELLERGPLINVPLDPRARLGTGYLTEKEVPRARDTADKVDLEEARGLDGLTWYEQALEAAEQYRGWLRQTADKGLGLFIHC